MKSPSGFDREFIPSPQIPIFPTVNERGTFIPYSSSPIPNVHNSIIQPTLNGYFSDDSDLTLVPGMSQGEDEFVVGNHYIVDISQNGK